MSWPALCATTLGSSSAATRSVTNGPSVGKRIAPCTLARFRRASASTGLVVRRWKLSDLLVGREAALGAGLPGEALQHQLAGALSHTLRQRWVAQQLGQVLVQLGDVARLNQEAGDAMLDHFDQAAQAAT